MSISLFSHYVNDRSRLKLWLMLLPSFLLFGRVFRMLPGDKFRASLHFGCEVVTQGIEV